MINHFIKNITQIGYTALMWASEKGHMKIVKLLLAQNGVDVDVLNTVSYKTLSMI